MSDGMGREPAYLSSHATNRYFIPNWGILWERKVRMQQTILKRKMYMEILLEYQLE